MFKKKSKIESSINSNVVELTDNQADNIIATGFHNNNLDYMKESYSSRVNETRAILSKIHLT